MTVATTCITETAALPAAVETAFPATLLKSRFILDKIVTFASAAGTITARVVPAGGTAGAAHVLAIKNFGVNESYTWPEITGTTLEAGDFISLLSTTGTVANVRISGRTAT